MKATYWILWIALPVSAVGVGLSLGKVTAQTDRTGRLADDLTNVRSPNVDGEVDELVAKLRSLEPGLETGEKAGLRDRLTELTREQFLQHEAIRERQVQAIEERVAKIRKTLALRAKNMEQIIEARVNSLLGESSALDWNFEVPASIAESDMRRDQLIIDTKLPDLANLKSVLREVNRGADEVRKLDDVRLSYEKNLLDLRQSIEVNEEARNALRDRLENAREIARNVAEKTQDTTNIDAKLQGQLNQSRRQVDELARIILDLSRQLEQKREEANTLERRLLPLRELESSADNFKRLEEFGKLPPLERFDEEMKLKKLDRLKEFEGFEKVEKIEELEELEKVDPTKP